MSFKQPSLVAIVMMTQFFARKKERKGLKFLENLMVGATNYKEQFLKVIIVFICVVLGPNSVLAKI
jgi:hypothetical protein